MKMYFITDVIDFFVSSVSLCIEWFKELCSNAVKKKHLMKLNCGTKVPLFVITFFGTNLGSQFKAEMGK